MTDFNTVAPDRYDSPFYAGSVFVAKCNECSGPDSLVVIPVQEALLHDALHDTWDASPDES